MSLADKILTELILSGHTNVSDLLVVIRKNCENAKRDYDFSDDEDDRVRCWAIWEAYTELTRMSPRRLVEYVNDVIKKVN